MSDQVKRTSKFLEAISNSAIKHIQQLDEEAKKAAREELQRAEDKVHLECHEKMDREVRKIRKKTDSILAEYRDENAINMSKKRQYIELQVFQAAEKEILEFTKTAKYAQSLSLSAKKIGDFFNSNDVVLYVREQDLGLAEELKKAFGKKCTVESDSENVLGGLRAVSKEKKLVADDTYSTRLQEQKKWFAENSGLKIV